MISLELSNILVLGQLWRGGGSILGKKLLILLLSLLLVGCSSADKVEIKTEFEQNEIVNSDDFEFQILEAYRSFGDDYLLDNGYLFVAVRLRVKNLSSSKQTISTFNFKMQNNQGVEVDASWNSNLGGSSFNGELLSNGEIEGTLYFEQPVDNSGLKLAYYRTMFDNTPEFKYIMSCDCSVPKLSKDVFDINETVTYNDVQNSVIGVDYSTGSGFSKASSGNTFIGITLKTINNSRDNVSINSYNWKLVDDNGVQYDVSYFGPFDQSEYPSTTLMSGGEVSGILVYEVPKNVGLKLSFYRNGFDEESVYSIKIK